MQVRLPRAHYEAGAWVGDEIVLARASTRDGHNVELWSIDADGDGSRWLRADRMRGCSAVDDVHPVSLPNGQLGFVRACRKIDGVERFWFMARTSAGAESVVMELPVPATRFSWSPDMKRAAISRTSGLCGGVAVVEEGRADVLDVDVAGAFNLADEFERTPSDTCRDTGLADWPAWSPRGDDLAFFASPESVGLDGFEKTRAPWNVYTLALGARDAEELLTGIRNPRGLLWTRDAGALLFSGIVEGRSGIWRFDVGEQRLSRIADLTASGLVLAPSGDLVAALSGDGTPSPMLSVFRVDS